MPNTGLNLTGKKVVIGLTGRVDSCVAALLLKKQGMHVIGVSIVTNSTDQYANESDSPKCHVSNLEKVKAFCDQLKIPFYATDAKAMFDDKVLDTLISARLSAQANSSCFQCAKLKIRVLYEKMKVLGADYISTGHYCKVQKNLNSDEFFIHSNNDVESDQSFLLAGIDKEHLRHLLLPLGELRNTEVQKIANKFNLNAMPSRDYRGFCFQDKNSYLPIARKRVPKSLIHEGQVRNVDTDLFHGDHHGIMEHYITESELEFKGTSTTDTDLEVVGYEFSTSQLLIGAKINLSFNGFQLVNVQFGEGIDKSQPISCYVKTKYSGQFIKCDLYFKNNSSVFIQTEFTIYPLIEGENLVIYDRNTRNAKVIGIGQVCRRGNFKLLDRVNDFKSIDEETGLKTTVETFKF